MSDNGQELEQIKYNLVLELVNKILVNIGKPEITDLTDFTKVDKSLLSEQSNIDILNDMEDEIYKYFEKSKCGYYRKTNSYLINFLRCSLKTFNYKLDSREMEKGFIANDVKYRKKVTVYSITK